MWNQSSNNLGAMPPSLQSQTAAQCLQSQIAGFSPNEHALASALFAQHSMQMMQMPLGAMNPFMPSVHQGMTMPVFHSGARVPNNSFGQFHGSRSGPSYVPRTSLYSNPHLMALNKRQATTPKVAMLTPSAALPSPAAEKNTDSEIEGACSVNAATPISHHAITSDDVSPSPAVGLSVQAGLSLPTVMPFTDLEIAAAVAGEHVFHALWRQSSYSLSDHRVSLQVHCGYVQ